MQLMATGIFDLSRSIASVTWKKNGIFLETAWELGTNEENKRSVPVRWSWCMGCPFQRRLGFGRDPGENILSRDFHWMRQSLREALKKSWRNWGKVLNRWRDDNFVKELKRHSHLARTRQGRRACTIQLREKVLPRISTHVPETEGENQSKLLKQTRTKEFS